MNTQFRDIEVLAWEQVKRTPDGLVKTDDFLQKFGELVVQECLKFIEPMPGSGDLDDVAFEGATREIKEHFGMDK